MTAGRGITHSERFERARAEGDTMHGIQAWVALPREDEEAEPSFAHHAGDDLPTYESGGLVGAARRRQRIRRARERQDPFADVLRALAIAGGCASGTAGRVPGARGVRCIGTVESAGQTFGTGQMVVFTPGEPGRLHRNDDIDDHAARRRARRRAVHRMEFRLVVGRAHRAGEGRLARGTDEAPGPRQSGVHSAAGRSAAARHSDVVMRVLGWRRFASPAARPRVAEGDLAGGNSASAPALHGCCPLAVPREAVHPQPMVKGLLRGRDLLRVALP